MELLRPFWRSIGFAVIKDIHNKPQKAQQLSDLTEQSVNSLLLLTHTDTLPHLVLTKRKDILQRIATARGTSIQDICTQPRRNLAGILALLLCQPVADVEKNAMDALVAVAPAFRENGNDLSDWVKLEPVMVACEVLKSAADQHETRRDNVSHLYFDEWHRLTNLVSSRLSYTCGACRNEKWATKDCLEEETALLFLRSTHIRDHGALLRGA
jgi:serine/threonine-protein kinase ATR